MFMKKAAGAVGLIIAVAFLVLGFTSTTPDKYIRSYGENKMYEYVGGDAYNYIIEASLRGGEIAGAKTARAIYFAAAGILSVLSVAFLGDEKNHSKVSAQIGSVKTAIGDVETAVGKLKETVAAGQKKNDAAFEKIIEQQAAALSLKPADKNGASES